ERASQFRGEHTQRAATYAEFKQIMEGRPGFVIASWCGTAECEAQIKTDTQATIRNMPLAGGSPGGNFGRSGTPATAAIFFTAASPRVRFSRATIARNAPASS